MDSAKQSLKLAKKYQWELVVTLLRRYSKQTFLVSLGSFSYFLFLSLGMIGRHVIRETIKIEEVPLFDNEELMGSTRQQLVQLLSHIEIGLFLLIAGLILFGLFFFMTGIRRQLLLLKEEIKIKCLVGSDLNQVTREFYWEQTFPIIISGGMALVVSDIIYGLVYLVLVFGYQQPWHSDWHYLLKGNGSVIIVGGIVWLWQYRSIKRGIGRFSQPRA